MSIKLKNYEIEQVLHDVQNKFFIQFYALI